MAYSNKMVPNDVKMFPPPQRWMTWIADIDWGWDQATNTRSYTAKSEGKLRHYHDFESARKGVRWVGSKSSWREVDWSGKYITDWAIYEWDEATGQWEERYSGYQGQDRDDNPLSKVRLTKDQKRHPIDAIQEDAVIASIREAAIRRSA